ncbi:unnamed protein product [Protopolystoma xenopodis]|uniref:Uncharacterized protein n=1 Tax=Protopolystoma xenopodis TaxID=117903 RepID=A0A448WRI0_9PLAT|nr:unnamed protein product [Protopolystoma xenopodis]
MLEVLATCAFKPMNFILLFFYQFLIEHGPEENRGLVDQDLIFYIEVLRYQVG